MVTKTEGKYPKTKKVIEQAMKIVQRELEDDMLKVELLETLLKIREKLNGRKPSSDRGKS